MRVEGQLTFNNLPARVDAAVSGMGLAFELEDTVASALAEGKPETALEPWCEPFQRYYLYYPSRKQHTQAFARLIEALRYKGLGAGW